ncbi:RagB/SusD family nutrient uptake outer membrane protein [Pedobacter sp. SYSU D00535]|uniref:RagB/SusD family nutrient uptake outer membrane protein n=1 Tax=Pedobacter sp. SYSU D00535 TaxID=2810308 RepID=UPI001A960D24|nr:RagB/SusD family nutrient uptake outer membrane protein [Pedobacter sp. SYSU D00535]
MKLYKILLTLSVLSLVFNSCKDDFLEEKGDLTGVNEEVFKDPFMAQAYVDYIYGLFQPADNANAFIHNQNGRRGEYNDDLTQTSEELGGQSDWNRPWNSIEANQAHASEYFGEGPQTGAQNNSWTRLRQINLFLDEIDKHGLPEETRTRLKGQLLFWRAYQYFEFLRRFGGVPLILTAQPPLKDDPSVQTPRSSSSATLEQIVKDLDAAINMLPPRWPNASADWGRITSGAAAALKGRVLLTWASPLFNRTDDKARWQRSYDANKAAFDLLKANGFGLYEKGTLANATAWEQMFFDQGADNPEAVIVINFNSTTTDQLQRNNGTERAARSKEVLGDGGISPTKQMLDAFPMKDGKMISDPTSGYDAKKFYKNRDPRFYKTFVYNGAVWPYGGNSTFRQWTYSWFTNATAATRNEPNKYTETRGPNATGIYLRKGTNPTASNQDNFQYSATDFMEMRFAEVVLNLAESAIGIDKLSEGLGHIRDIRRRAGFESNGGTYGITNVVSRDEHFAAVLNERKIEFAYEGKRFWDLKRWMLFYEHPEVHTVSRLKMQPLNGTRRTGLWIYVKNTNGTKYVGNDDPLLKRANGTVPVVEREPAPLPNGFATYDAYLDHLYDNYFEVIERDNVDPTNPADWKFTWYNEYYFMGIHQNVLLASPYLEQTQGWKNHLGQSGTFDPLK